MLCGDVCQKAHRNARRPSSAQPLIEIECAWRHKIALVRPDARSRRYCGRECVKAFNSSAAGRARYKDRPYWSPEAKAIGFKQWYDKTRKPFTNPDWRRDGRVFVPWNKGETADSDPRIAAGAEKQRGTKRKPLSDEQRARMRASARRGPANNKWKGGITSDNIKWRQSPEYKAWRIAVFRRDHFTCQNCGANAHGRGTLVAHHLKSWHEYPDLRFDVENGQTLCRPCHAIIDPYVKQYPK